MESTVTQIRKRLYKKWAQIQEYGNFAKIWVLFLALIKRVYKNDNPQYNTFYNTINNRILTFLLDIFTRQPFANN